MAPGDGSREIPDSEDEPMTSSPVNVSEAAADKLSATAPVPLQDVQDALQEVARPHQAIAENVANAAAGRVDGLGVDRNIASFDIDASRVDTTDMQPNAVTSTQGADNIAFPQAATAMDKTQKGPRISNHGLTTELVATTCPNTDFTMQTPEVGFSNEQANAGDQLESAAHGTAFDQTEQWSPSKAMQEAIIASNSPNSAQEVEGYSTKPSASQEVPGQPSSSWDQNTSSPEPTSLIAEEAPIRSGYVLGDGGARQMSMDITSQVQAIGSGNTFDANHAVTINEDQSPNAHGYTGAIDAAHDVPEIREHCAATAGVSSDQQALQIRPDLVGADTKTRNSATAMDIDISHPNAATEAHTLDKDDASLLNSSTDDVANNAPSMDAMNTPTATGSNSGTGLRPTTAAESSTNSQLSTPNQPNTTDNGPTITKSPQEITLAELKAQRSAMLASLATLPAIQVLMEENASSDGDMSNSNDEPTESDIMAAANKIVKDHIKLLHEYNELKDVGQGLMGLIADQRGVRIVEVQEEFGIDAQD